MRTQLEEIEARMRRLASPRAKTAPAPAWNERPMALLFLAGIALTLLANVLLNAFPG